MKKVIISQIKSDKTLLRAFAFCSILPVFLFIFKDVDNNSLCRWPWIFDEISSPRLFIIYLIFLAASFFSANYNWPANKVKFLGVLSFVLAMLFWNMPEIIIDASRYFTHAKFIERYGLVKFYQEWGHDLTPWTDLPLTSIIYGIAFKFFGEHRLAIQIINSLFYTGSILLTYNLGKLLWNKETGFMAGLLLLGFPYLFLHIPLMMVDLTSMFFLILAIYMFTLALNRQNGSIILLAAFCICLACLNKYSNLLYLSILPVISIVFAIQKKTAIIKTSFFVFILSLLFLLLLIINKIDIIGEQLSFLLSYQQDGLKKWSEGYISTFFFHIHPLISIAALGGVVVAWRTKNVNFIIAAYLLLLVFGLQIKRIRYILQVFPMLALMAAYGLNTLENNKLKRFLLFSIVAGSLTLAIGAYLPFAKKISSVNLQKAGHFINRLNTENVLIYTETQSANQANLEINIPLLDMFTSKNIYLALKNSQNNISEDKTTSFRFTWENKLPDFYTQPPNLSEKTPLVIISSRHNPILPQSIRQIIKSHGKIKRFSTHTGQFSYKTFVTVYYDN